MEEIALFDDESEKKTHMKDDFELDKLLYLNEVSYLQNLNLKRKARVKMRTVQTKMDLIARATHDRD